MQRGIATPCDDSGGLGRDSRRNRTPSMRNRTPSMHSESTSTRRDMFEQPSRVRRRYPVSGQTPHRRGAEPALVPAQLREGRAGGPLRGRRGIGSAAGAGVRDNSVGREQCPPRVLDLLQERRAPGNAARRRQCRLHRVPDGQPHDRGADVSARPARDAPFAAAHRDMGRLDRRRPVQRRSAQTQFKSFGVPEISKVGVELDRKPAALLDALDVDVSRALLES